MDNFQLLEQQAIDSAINNQWQEAVKLNKKILKIDKKNIDAYLRLGFALLQLGNLSQAKKIYKKALQLQPNNATIIKYLEKIKVLLNKKEKINQSEINSDPNLFLETPGKTKIVNLVNLGQKNILAKLVIGQSVYIFPKKRRIDVRTSDNEFIGYLPDDISKRLLIFIKAGSSYSAYIKEVSFNKVLVFLREETKGKKVAKFTSFPTGYYSPTALSEKEDETEEVEEEINESDLEKLAEVITTEEKDYKDYLPYQPDEEEESEE